MIKICLVLLVVVFGAAYWIVRNTDENYKRVIRKLNQMEVLIHEKIPDAND